jgi:hypothetical protein
MAMVREAGWLKVTRANNALPKIAAFNSFRKKLRKQSKLRQVEIVTRQIVTSKV